MQASLQGDQPAIQDPVNKGPEMIVLLAVDHPATRQQLADLLAAQGCRAQVSDDAAGAWPQTAQQDARVLICDGDHRRPAGRYVHVIRIVQPDQAGAAALAAGADDLLHLPLQGSALAARLAVAARMIRLEDQQEQHQRRVDDLTRRVSEQSTTDPLMGVGTRRGFEQTIRQAHINARKHRLPYGVLMADVDRFKAYNDHYGHQSGDRVLVGVAGVMRRIIRGGDRIFRYGGEELVLVSRVTSEAGLDALGQRLRQGVEGLNLEHRGADHGVVTCSFGGALYRPTDDPPWAELVERADQALYSAKERGRNRVVMWQG